MKFAISFFYGSLAAGASAMALVFAPLSAVFAAFYVLCGMAALGVSVTVAMQAEV